ncbi:MAG: ABC transporter permease [Spirochaetales bacterium]|uniref:ABC transporter permease n=1 Tax=Candidatus Thalassospirochaeta sargassi TaxID=3119039 RepID=A0AAJ1MME4_9SPIO|nr:ABC transporter permease [Spirochaetales bacterium]
MSSEGFSIPIIHNSISIMTPFLLAAIGGLMTELSGMLNIALEGLILIGAFFSVIFAAATGSLLLGILLGILMTILVSWVFGAITIYLKANVFITGLATNLLASGLTAVLSFHIFGTKGVLMFEELPPLPSLNVPPLHKIPVLGDIFFGHNVFVYMSWIIVVIAWFAIYRTPFGFRLRGTGSNPKAMIAIGLNPQNYQMLGILISGFTCGLAGAVLTLNLGAYVPHISSGRGWIALVVIYLGGKTPFGILGAAFVFGLAESFSNYAQGFIDIPADFILAFPYIITAAAMVIMSIVQNRNED